MDEMYVKGEVYMMKKLKRIAGLVIVIGMLTGCTNYAKQYDQNTLVVNRNGSFVEVSVEDFKDSKVKPEDIESYVREQVDNYNSNYGNDIKVNSIDYEDLSHVKLVVSYKNVESYDAFNLLECSLTDISDTDESQLTGSYTSSEDKKAAPSDIIAEGKGKVLIISEATDVVVKGSILYYNDEVTVKDGVATTSGNKNAVIVFK